MAQCTVASHGLRKEKGNRSCFGTNPHLKVTHHLASDRDAQWKNNPLYVI